MQLVLGCQCDAQCRIGCISRCRCLAPAVNLATQPLMERRAALEALEQIASRQCHLRVMLSSFGACIVSSGRSRRVGRESVRRAMFEHRSREMLSEALWASGSLSRMLPAERHFGVVRCRYHGRHGRRPCRVRRIVNVACRPSGLPVGRRVAVLSTGFVTFGSRRRRRDFGLAGAIPHLACG